MLFPCAQFAFEEPWGAGAVNRMCVRKGGDGIHVFGKVRVNGVLHSGLFGSRLWAWLRGAVEQIATDEQFRETLTDMGEFVTFEDGEAFEARARRDMETSRTVLENPGMLGMNN